MSVITFKQLFFGNITKATNIDLSNINLIRIVAIIHPDHADDGRTPYKKAYTNCIFISKSEIEATTKEKYFEFYDENYSPDALSFKVVNNRLSWIPAGGTLSQWTVSIERIY